MFINKKNLGNKNFVNRLNFPLHAYTHTEFSKLQQIYRGCDWSEMKSNVTYLGFFKLCVDANILLLMFYFIHSIFEICNSLLRHLPSTFSAGKQTCS